MINFTAYNYTRLFISFVSERLLYTLPFRGDATYKKFAIFI